MFSLSLIHFALIALIYFYSCKQQACLDPNIAPFKTRNEHFLSFYLLKDDHFFYHLHVFILFFGFSAAEEKKTLEAVDTLFVIPVIYVLL